jgi:hypothetical protein
MEVSGKIHAAAAFIPVEMPPPYPFHNRLGGPGGEEKEFLPLPGIDLRLYRP